MTEPTAPKDDRRLVYGLLAVGMAVFFGEQLFYFHYYHNYPQLTYGILHLTQQIDWESERLFAHVFRTNYYPPLYDVFMDVAYRTLGCDYQRIVLAQAVCFLLAAFYLTRLARLAGLGPYAFAPGILLLVSVVGIPLMQNFAIESLLPLPIVAYAFHLVAADKFRQRRHAVLAGVWGGLGMLTKWSFVFYTVGLTLWVVAGAFYNADARGFKRLNGRQAANLGLWAGAALVVAGWWYALYLPWDFFFKTSVNDPNQLLPRWLADAVGFCAWCPDWDFHIFPQWLFEGRWTDIGYTICRLQLAEVAALALLLAPRRGRALGLTLLTVILPGAIFVSFPHTEARYYWPIAAAFSFCAALPLAHIRRNWVKIPYLAAIWAMALSGFVINVQDRWRPVFNNNGSEQLVKFIETCAPRRPNRPVMMASHPLWDNQHIKDYNIKYYLRRHNLWDKRFYIDRHYFFYYSLFHENLLNGKYDIVFTDCGPANDCMHTRTDFVQGLAHQSQTAPFVDMASGKPVGAFGDTELQDDIAHLATRYRPFLKFPLADGSCTRVWMKPELFLPRRPGR
jgi:hypothetical protein